MRELITLLETLNAQEALEKESLLQIQEQIFLITTRQREMYTCQNKKPFFAGNCLGRKKGDFFYPSVWLLDIISKYTSKKIIVDKKTEWLFVCGRDIFSGILDVQGNPQEKDLVLVLNQFKECIGIAHYMTNPTKKKPITHVYDIGDYLRRERTKKL